MTEIKIGDDMLAAYHRGEDGCAGARGGRHDSTCCERSGLASFVEALVASGWRREAPADGNDPFVGEALADPATRMAYRSGVERAAMLLAARDYERAANEQFAAGETTSGTLSRVIADAFRRRASEAEQYVSAGTRDGEDQKRDEEETKHG